MFAITVGVLSALAILVVMCRFGIRKFVGYPAVCDIGVTLVLCFMLYGTILGMVAAIVGGLVFSGMITVIRRVYGYERLTLRGWKRYPGYKGINTKVLTEPVQTYWHAVKNA